MAAYRRSFLCAIGASVIAIVSSTLPSLNAEDAAQIQRIELGPQRKITEAEVNKIVEDAKKRDTSADVRAEFAVQNCRRIFGDSVDFRNTRLAAALAFVAPVPVEQRHSLAGKRLDEQLREWQRPMLERRWFAKGWGPDHEHSEPISYHFRSPDQPLLDSTLYYEWSSHDVLIRVTESSSGALAELQKPNLDLKKGIPKADFVKLLRSVFAIPDRESVVIGSIETVPLDLGELLSLPDTIREGTVFGSLKSEKTVRSGFTAWYYATMGFVTDKSIGVVLWRPNHPGHLEQKGVGTKWAHGFGHFEDPEWLDTAVFEADGKTRVKPPSIAPKGSKRDEP